MCIHQPLYHDSTCTHCTYSKQIAIYQLDKVAILIKSHHIISLYIMMWKEWVKKPTHAPWAVKWHNSILITSPIINFIANYLYLYRQLYYFIFFFIYIYSATAYFIFSVYLKTLSTCHTDVYCLLIQFIAPHYIPATFLPTIWQNINYYSHLLLFYSWRLFRHDTHDCFIYLLDCHIRIRIDHPTRLLIREVSTSHDIRQLNCNSNRRLLFRFL